MAESLNPTPLSRLAGSLRPDWTRTVLARRLTAGALVMLAGVAALRSNPAGDRTGVVVATRDLGPGITLTADDVHLENRLATTVPDGSQTRLDAVAGSTLAGPTRRGEVLTDVRLLGTRLVESAAGPNARIVPVHPADTGLIDVVRPGDVVDILATAAGPAPQPGGAPTMVATDAVVVLVSQQQARTDDRVVLVALPLGAANAVAGAALAQTVTFTLH